MTPAHTSRYQLATRSTFRTYTASIMWRKRRFFRLFFFTVCSRTTSRRCRYSKTARSHSEFECEMHVLPRVSNPCKRFSNGLGNSGVAFLMTVLVAAVPRLSIGNVVAIGRHPRELDPPRSFIFRKAIYVSGKHLYNNVASWVLFFLYRFLFPNQGRLTV